MTAAAYSGLAVLGVVGSPVIVGAVLLGGGPYLAYRVVKARRGRARRAEAAYAHPLQRDSTTVRSRHARAAARSILQPDELLTNDDEFDSGSTRYTAFSDIVVAEARTPLAAVSTDSLRPRRARSQRVEELSAEVLVSVDSATVFEGSHADGFRNDVELDKSVGLNIDERIVPDEIPSVNVEPCRASRPFILERRRGSVGGVRIMRRPVLPPVL